MFTKALCLILVTSSMDLLYREILNNMELGDKMYSSKETGSA